MKKLLLIVIGCVLFSTMAYCQTWVPGHSRSDGAYVPGYYRTNPNDTVRDNYSYVDNYNPYTGQQGTNYYRDDPSSGYYGTRPKRDTTYDFGW